MSLYVAGWYVSLAIAVWFAVTEGWDAAFRSAMGLAIGLFLIYFDVDAWRLSHGEVVPRIALRIIGWMLILVLPFSRLMQGGVLEPAP